MAESYWLQGMAFPGPPQLSCAGSCGPGEPSSKDLQVPAGEMHARVHTLALYISNELNSQVYITYACDKEWRLREILPVCNQDYCSVLGTAPQSSLVC